MRTLFPGWLIALAFFATPAATQPAPMTTSAATQISVNGQTTTLGAALNSPGYDLIVCAGQSFPAGRGVFDPLIDVRQSPGIYSWDGAPTDVHYQQILNQVEPLYQFEGYEGVAAANGINSDSIGLCGEYARRYHEWQPSGRRVLIVPVAYGQTGMFYDNPGWSPTAPGTLYTNLNTQTNAALAAVNAQYPLWKNQISVLLWGQGENDDFHACNNQTSYGGCDVTEATYASGWDALWNGWKAATGAASAIGLIFSDNPYYDENLMNGAVPLAWADTPRRDPLTAYVPRLDGLGMGMAFSQWLYNTPSFCTATTGFPAAYPSAAARGLTCPRTSTGDSAHLSDWATRMLADLAWQATAQAYANVTDATEMAPSCAPTLKSVGTYATAVHLIWSYCSGFPSPNGVVTNTASRVSGAIMQYQLAGSGTWNTYDPVANNGWPFANGNPDLDLLNLTPGMLYNFRVAAVNEKGTGPWSNVVNVSTLSTATASMSRLRNFFCSAASATSAACTWSAPNDGDTATGTTLIYGWQAPAGSGSSSGAAVSVGGYTGFSGTLSSLPWAGTLYYAYGKVSNSAGSGPGNLVTYFTTPGTQVAPNAPTGLTYVSSGPGSLSFTWTAASSGYPAYDYALKACVHSTTTCTTSITSNNATSGAISGLSASGSYDVSVAGVNNGGTGTFSGSLTESTTGFDYLVSDVGATPYATCDLARAQSSTQTGPLLHVIRSSDGTGVDIGTVNGALDTATLLAFVGTSSSSQGYLSACYDPVSGRTVNLTSTSTTLPSTVMPRIVLNGALVTSASGAPGMQIYNGTEFLENISVAGLPGAADFTVSLVYTPTLTTNANAANPSMVSATDSGTAFRLGQVTNTNFFASYIAGVNQNATTNALTATQNHLVVFTYQNSTKFGNAWIDGTQVLTNAAFTTAAAGNFLALGNWPAHSPSNWPSPGPVISELDVWNTVLTTPQMNAIRASDQGFFATP